MTTPPGATPGSCARRIGTAATAGRPNVHPADHGWHTPIGEGRAFRSEALSVGDESVPGDSFASPVPRARHDVYPSQYCSRPAHRVLSVPACPPGCRNSLDSTSTLGVLRRYGQRDRPARPAVCRAPAVSSGPSVTAAQQGFLRVRQRDVRRPRHGTCFLSQRQQTPRSGKGATGSVVVLKHPPWE